jgi:hypothetical protein
MPQKKSPNHMLKLIPIFLLSLLGSSAFSIQKLFGRLRGLSRKTNELRGASRKQSPPVSGMGSGIPLTLNQQLPRETIPKWASSDGETFLPDGVTFSSICAPRIRPQGAVASSLE